LNSKLYGLHILFTFFEQEENPFQESEQDFFRFYNLYPVQYTVYAAPAHIISNFMLHTVEEALRGTAFNSAFHFVLDFNTLSECGIIGGTEFKQFAVFVLKQLAHIPNVVLSDSQPATSD
jgi:hypothetical protein